MTVVKVGAAVPAAGASDPIQAVERRRQTRLRILLPLLLALLALVATYTTNYVPSASMLPTIKPGDHTLTMKAWIAYPNGGLPNRGDIIIFRLPENATGGEDPDNEAGGSDTPDPASKRGKRARPVLIKRVIGLPGDTVLLHGNDVLINGKKLTENYEIVPLETEEGLDASFAVGTPYTIPPGHIFVLGDNRNNSDDSRFWGTLTRKDIIGRFIRVLFHESPKGPNASRKPRYE